METKKRFRVAGNNLTLIFDEEVAGKIYEKDDVEVFKDLCDLLNHQNETIKSLKEKLDKIYVIINY